MAKTILSLLILFTYACGRNGEQSASTTLQFVAGESSTFDQYQGGVLVNAWTNSGAPLNQTFLYNSLQHLTLAGVDLKSGHQWIVQVFAWKGTNGNLTGDISCTSFSLDVPLDTPEIQKPIVLTRAKCALNLASTNATPVSAATGNFLGFIAQACEPTTYNPSTIVCSQTGITPSMRYFQIGFARNNLTNIGKVVLKSDCSQMETFTAINIPPGYEKDGVSAPFPTVLRVFSDATCTEASLIREIKMLHGLAYPYADDGSQTVYNVDPGADTNYYFGW